MSTFPADIIVDILSRLPVKSLIRFRCVSKAWCSLIYSPNFIKMHLNHSIEHNTNLSLIFQCPHLYSVDFDTLDNAVELNHPLKSVDSETEVLSSCNGLLCLFNTKNDICLWNPSTRKHQMVPTMPIESPRAKCISTFYIYGFGYDSVNDEYKLVRMVQFDGKDFSNFCSEVRVYSLKANSWRRIQDCPYYLHFNTYFDVLSNGALHWVVTRRLESDEELVVAFDLALEEFEEVSQPEYLDKSFDMNLGVLGGCLCILCNYNRVLIDIWVMEYGVKESWTKLFSVSEQEIGRCFVNLRPLAYSKDGKEVLLESDRTMNIWYDLEKKSVRNAQIRGIRNYMEANICVESLVPVNGGSRIDGMKQ